MPLFKNTIRSAHGMFSQKRVSDASRSSASTTTSSTQKGSSSELAPAYVDSVMAPDADAQAKADGSGGAINEPLVLDFPTMLDGADPNTNGAPLSPVISLVDLERRTSWLSDDDDSAPAPRIEFARREIHIPSRTSSTTPQAIQHRVELQRRLSQEPTSPLAPTTPERLRSRAHSYSRTSIASPNRSLSSRNPQTPGRSHTPIPQSITPQRSHTSNSYFATPDRSYTSNPYIGTPRRSQAPIPETSPQKRSQTPIPQTSPQKRSQTPVLQGSPPKRSQTPVLQGSPQKRSQTPILQGSPQKRSQTPVPQTSPQKRSQTPNPQTPAAVETEQATMRSSADSVISYQSTAPSVATNRLGPLQQKGGTLEEGDRLSPLLEDDPNSFDLVCAPMENGSAQFSLEDRSEQLFSKEHLQAIFADTSSLLRFTSFLSTYRPNSVPTLVYYLDALKALRAINYANAVAEALEPINNLGFTETPVRATVNANLEEKANQAFDVLVRDDLPAFITHVFVQVASVSISKRVTGNLPPMLREASEGLAEVFCLTDPSRTDNPIIFASEEFHRTTQYGVGYAIGRNCRFLQGPRTNRNSVARFKKAIQEGRDHNEVFLNYRRDGSPFMNLLMVAPLLDSRGTLRYHIGAQIDVTGLARDATDLEAFQRMIHQDQDATDQEQSKEEFKALCEMFNHTELETVRRYGGNMHREHLEEKDEASMNHKPRVLIQDQSTFDVIQAEKQSAAADGRLSGPYKHYLIVRPAPSLRILFTSPSLRVPGILQSRFLDRIGGSNRVRDSLGDALADGSRGVTAKIRWLTHPVADLEDATDEGRPRWIHCTPLLGQNGAVGVWMVVLVDEKDHAQANRRFRQAPPIPNDIRGHSLASSPFPRTNTRLSDYSEENNSSYPSRTASPYANSYNNGYGISNGISNGYGSGNGYGNGNGNGVGRISAMENLRRPVTPRRGQSPMYDQRTPNSGTSSVKDFANGNTSVDSFRI